MNLQEETKFISVFRFRVNPLSKVAGTWANCYCSEQLACLNDALKKTKDL